MYIKLFIFVIQTACFGKETLSMYKKPCIEPTEEKIRNISNTKAQRTLNERREDFIVTFDLADCQAKKIAKKIPDW